MIDIIIGAAAGFVGGYVVKSQASSEKDPNTGRQYSSLFIESQAENEKLKSQLCKREAELEELNERVKDLKRQLHAQEDKVDDRLDDINDLRKSIEKLRQQNKELTQKASDYESLYLAAQQEIEGLKG